MSTEAMHLNLDDFPDSPYASELRRGVSIRPFSPDIESQYLLHHLARVKPRARLWFFFQMLAAIGFSYLQVRVYGLWSAATVLLFGPLIPAAVFMLFVVSSSRYEKWFLPAAGVVVPVTEGVVMVYLAQTLADGQPQAVGGLVLNSFAVFFFSGLLFRFALLSGLVMFASFAFAIYHYQLPVAVSYPTLAVMGVTVFLAAIVQRGTEIAYRRTFLERALVQQLAARDGLTGVMNRRAFDEHLRRIWQQALRDKRALGLVMIDIDYFKAYNDYHGHQAGDSALRQVAQVIQGFARRPLDMAARYGGEEFVMILYDLDREKLGKIAEQLRQAIADRKIEHGAGGAGAYVTVSIGLGIVQPSLGRTPQGAVQFADEALYQAKEAGRNQVVIRTDDEYRTLKTGVFASAQTIRVRP